MAYCNQTLKGITLSCDNNKGGIKTVYIANYGDVVKPTPEGDIINTIEMVGNAKFYPYQFRKNTGSMTSTLTADESNGLNYVTTEISLVFTKMQTKTRVELAALSIGQLAVIVEDSNSTYWYCTMDDYAAASAGTGETGVAKGDRNAFSLTLSVENDSYPIEVSAAAVQAVVATIDEE